jgi:hypothetical protein
VPSYISRGDALSIREKIYNFWKRLPPSLSVPVPERLLELGLDPRGQASALQRSCSITRRTRLMRSQGCQRRASKAFTSPSARAGRQPWCSMEGDGNVGHFSERHTISVAVFP